MGNPKNTFEALKKKFSEDTGIVLNEQTMPLYIEYYKAIMLTEIFHQIGIIAASVIDISEATQKK